MGRRKESSYNVVSFINHRATQFLLCFLALSALALSAWQGYSFFVGRLEQDVLAQNAIRDRLHLLQDKASGILSGGATVVHLVANSTALQEFAENENLHRKNLEKLFFALIEASPNVYQVRYIDNLGFEKIRIEKKESVISIAPKDRLQNKLNRDYFKNTFSLEAGQIYVSELNLNVEYGQVQDPWLPTLRISSPVYNAKSQAVGILIVNLDVSALVELYTTSGLHDGSEVMMVNNNGYWLAGKPREKLWGFMFGKTETLEKESPKVWSGFNENHNDIVEDEQDRWTFQSTRVTDVFPTGLNYQNRNKILWYALSKNPSKHFALRASSTIPSIFVLLVFGGFSWVWAKSLVEQRRAEKELIKSEKLSSLGGLVAGVAHELNTPIGSAVTMTSTMQDHAEIISQEIKSGAIKKTHIIQFIDDVLEASKISLRGLYRANELIGHFKQVAVDQSGEIKREFNLDDYLQDMTATFEHLFRHGEVGLELQLSSGATLNTFPGSLSQVVINLVQNSLKHGFQEEDTGLVKVISQMGRSGSVEIIVEDNGCGISPHLIDRVIEPFYTTKLGQGGSGLGLHIVHNIVQDVLDGELKIFSDPEKNITRFTVVIPCSRSTYSEILIGEKRYEEPSAA